MNSTLSHEIPSAVKPQVYASHTLRFIDAPTGFEAPDSPSPLELENQRLHTELKRAKTQINEEYFTKRNQEGL